MNGLWSGMMLVGIVYGILTGRVSEVSEALLSSAKEAVTLCVTMCGAMALWSGMMEIATMAGLIHAISRKIHPLMCFLFPNIPEEHPALEHITTNCVANVLGLGSAATVYGLKAMETIEELEEERREERQQEKGKQEEVRQEGERPEEEHRKSGRRKEKYDAKRAWKRRLCRKNAVGVPSGTASDEMCDFLILNISSLQLIPITIIACRSQYGSMNPTAIVGPGIAATAVSTGAAIGFCKLKHWISKNYVLNQ